MSTRRTFLSQAALVGAGLSLPLRCDAAGNAAPAAQAFQPLPLGQIKPAGWLKRQLALQASGLSGRLDETWPDVGANSAWLGGTGESFERGPYWLDGLIPLAYLLQDERLQRKAQPWIEWTLRSQRSDGNFGPETKTNDWWPRMVMLKALAQYHEATLDARVPPFMQAYFAYQLRTLPSQPLLTWGKFRWQDNVLSVLWLWERFSNPDLLALARLLYRQGYDWQAQFANFAYTGPTPRALCKEMPGTGGYHETHGVDIAMGLKSAAVWSRVSGQPDGNSAARMLAVLDRYHGLPNGLYSAAEHLQGRDPSQGTELCTVVELMYSLEQAIAASGDVSLADRLEVIAYNALPGTLTDDMWAHQYDQQPNQIECSHRKRPWDNGPDANLFGLAPNYGCCTANFHQGWPKLASSLWMRSPDGGLAAIVYAPCSIATTIPTANTTAANTTAAGSHAVQLQVETDYPFHDRLRIHVHCQRDTMFPLHLREPAWGIAFVRVNGRLHPAQAVGGMRTIRRRWSAHDVVEVQFNMAPRLVPGVGNTISVRRGPLVFSLPLDEQWTKLRDQGLTADWQVTSSSAWAVALLADRPISAMEMPVPAVPFSKAAPAVTVVVQTQPVTNWRAQDGNAGPLPANLEFAEAGPRATTLMPYGCTKLRVTAFPQTQRRK